jgi:steroid delta-isomerase-like uncharacterized protein
LKDVPRTRGQTWEAEMNKDELIALDDRGLADWDAHDVDGFAAMFADTFVYTDDTVPGAMTSVDQVQQYMSGWFTAFPEMRVKGLNRVVGDDAVAAEIEFTGTNSGPLRMGGMELPATGREITGHGTYFFRANGGKITEFHAHPNAAEMMMQLGLMPG